MTRGDEKAKQLSIFNLLELTFFAAVVLLVFRGLPSTAMFSAFGACFGYLISRRHYVGRLGMLSIFGGTTFFGAILGAIVGIFVDYLPEID